MHALWNIFFSLFFLVLIALSFAWLAGEGRLVADMPFLHILLLSLATFRLTRLFSYDHITAFLRDWLARYGEHTFLGTAGALLRCPWCTGVWFAFLAYVGYAAMPALVLPLALILAIAAIGSTLQIYANLIGWKAEAKKRDVLG